MDKTRANLVALINEQKPVLIDSIAGMFYQSRKEQLERHGIGPDKVKKFIFCDLTALTESIAHDNTRLFANYISWLVSVLDRKGRSSDEISENLHFMKDIFALYLPKVFQLSIEEYIQAGINVVNLLNKTHLACRDHTDKYSTIACCFLDALRRFQRKEAIECIRTEINNGIPTIDLYYSIFQPVLYEIGRQWQAGQVNSVLGHFAADVVCDVLSMVPPPEKATNRNSKSIAAACVTEELHDIGLRMITNNFDNQGWNAVFLGSNIPARSIYEYVMQFNPDLLLISTTIPLRLKRVEKLIRLIRDNKSLKTKTIVGGIAFNLMPDEWRNIGADAFAFDSASAIEAAGRLV